MNFLELQKSSAGLKVTGLREMRKAIFLNVVAIFLIGVFITQAQAENLKRVESVVDIEHFLSYQDSGGILDFGHYLKGGGIKELNELCQSFYEEGFRLWIITIPKSMPVNVAESIYGNMNYDEKDILIVFKPRRLYGKTQALKSESEKFKEYVEQSRKDTYDALAPFKDLGKSWRRTWRVFCQH
jgi:hypothetical protein